MITWGIPLVILVTTIADAYTDRSVDRKVGWWEWHIPKWIRLYAPMVPLTYWWYSLVGINVLSVVYGVMFTIVCWVLWKVVYGT